MRNKVITVAVLLLVAVVCWTFKWNPLGLIETTQTVESGGTITLKPGAIETTDPKTKKKRTTRYGPAADPIINGKKVTFRWSGITFQPWVGVCYAGGRLEPMGAIGLAFILRDLVEVGPMGNNKRVGAGAWLRLFDGTLAVGGGKAWRFDDGKGSLYAAGQMNIIKF